MRLRISHKQKRKTNLFNKIGLGVKNTCRFFKQLNIAKISQSSIYRVHIFCAQPYTNKGKEREV